MTYLAPDRASDMLDHFSNAVTRCDRQITIGVGGVVGLRFPFRARDGLAAA